METESDMVTLAKVQRMAERMKKVGMIEIKVHRQMYGKRGGPVETSTKNILKRKERESVPEKSVKGKNVRSDCTTYVSQHLNFQVSCAMTDSQILRTDWEIRRKFGKAMFGATVN